MRPPASATCSGWSSCGWWLALGHITTGIALCITIIGIPLGIANFKLIPVSLFPFGKEIVSTDDQFAGFGSHPARRAEHRRFTAVRSSSQPLSATSRPVTNVLDSRTE